LPHPNCSIHFIKVLECFLILLWWQPRTVLQYCCGDSRTLSYNISASCVLRISVSRSFQLNVRVTAILKPSQMMISSTDTQNTEHTLPYRILVLQERQFMCDGENEARSHNHVYRVKSITITYSMWMYVALVIQHAKRMRCVIVSVMACPVISNFSTFSRKWDDFRRKKILTIQCVLWFLYIIVWNISYSTNNW
jgi:hypothetical protein